jgi:hypothetical protein
MAGNKPPLTPIEVRVENISQLFDTLDPFPFPERDLDSDAEEYIVGWARELPQDQPIKLIVHVTAGQPTEQETSLVGTALNRYFEYRVGIISRDLNELFRVGRTTLLIGLSVLALCLIAAQFTARRLGDTELGQFIQQSLIILGWVANWKPIETFLYDWLPLVRRRNLYHRLALAKIEVRHHP